MSGQKVDTVSDEIEIKGTEKFDGTYQVKSEIQKVIAEIREKQKEKSFSERHPELGKMVNCLICDRRHRTSEICLQRFAKTEEGVERVTRGHGHGKGRINRHWNKRSLELVDLTRRLIIFYPNGNEDVKKARSTAMNILRRKWHARSQQIQHQQKLSRKINRG
jgi:hypothetical protein